MADIRRVSAQAAMAPESGRSVRHPRLPFAGGAGISRPSSTTALQRQWLRRTPCRIGKRGSVTKPHHEIRTSPGKADETRQFRPQSRHFDGLVDEGVFESERGRLQREALAGAADQAPVLLVVDVSRKDGYAGR